MSIPQTWEVNLMPSRLRVATFLVLLATVPQARAQIVSGPEAGAKAPSLPVYVATGDRAEKTVDFVTERKDKPTVYLLVQNAHWGRPVARFIRSVDTALAKSDDGVEAVAVWFADEPDSLKTHLPRVQMSINLAKTTLTVFEGPKIGPAGWALNDAAHVTVVYVKNGKVVKNLSYDSEDEAHVQEVLDALKSR